MSQVHVPPKRYIEKERIFKYFRNGKSVWRRLCSRESFLRALLKWSISINELRVVMLEGTIVETPIWPTVCTELGRWQRRALWVAGYLSLNCCSAGRCVGDSVLIHQFEIHMAQQLVSMNKHFPSCPLTWCQMAASGKTSVLDPSAFVLS